MFAFYIARANIQKDVVVGKLIHRGMGTLARETNDIGKVGVVFFSSLVIGTFGLGCWQTQRYFEKQEMIASREEQLNQPPSPLEKYSMCSLKELRPDASPVHRFKVGYYYGNEEESNHDLKRTAIRGTFRLDKTVLVGPRGPPPGALASSGPSAGRSSGNMATSPQGYFLISPFYRADQSGVLLVNRGWIPLSLIQNEKERNKIIFGTDQVPQIESIEGVVSYTEQPKRFSPPSRTLVNTQKFQQQAQQKETFNATKRRFSSAQIKTLLWLDRVALEEDTQTVGLYPTYIVQTETESGAGQWPVKPSLDTVGEFKVTPSTHFGYAVTWFGLSGCGAIMTRKLLLKR